MAAKYDPLRHHLAGQGGRPVDMTFREIERVLRASLPQSARTYPAWWSNEDVRSAHHVQCRSWQAAGYVASANLASEKVSFRRIK